MSLDVKALTIQDVKVVRPRKFEDARGFFSETYNQRVYTQVGIDCHFVQDNHAFSKSAGTVRGLHYQGRPFAQDKLVRVVVGRIFDVAVDLRRSSPTFGKWVGVELSADEWNQILIPTGFAHGLCTLEPNTEVIYKVSNYYSEQHDFGIRWDDPDLNVTWPMAEHQIVLSDKDRRLPLLRDIRSLF
jgi:dTDP-4-dehydrorhamnose 3,5-epimerase